MQMSSISKLQSIKSKNNELMHDISIGVCKVCEKQTHFGNRVGAHLMSQTTKLLQPLSEKVLSEMISLCIKGIIN